MESRVAVAARAKVNLFLEVLGKRPDGYHEIETVIQEIDLADELTLESLGRGGPRLEVLSEGDPSVPSGPGNIVHAAASLFLERFAPDAAVRVSIRKRIPSGAGLGGGSADAAAALRGLARLLRVDAPAEEIARIASRVGSDVPFFLTGGLAVARGRGERVEPVASPARLGFVVVSPPFPCSTAGVYGALANSLTIAPRSPTILLRSLRSGSWSEIGKVLFNRLEEPAFRLEPRLRELRDRLAAAACPHPALMTGSGSSLVAVTGTAAEARELGARLVPDFGERGCRVHVARGVASGER